MDTSTSSDEIVHAELKRLHSPDVWSLPDLKTQPGGGEFSVFLQAIIGLKGVDSEESFDLIVCNPEWLASQCRDRIVVGQNLLIVSSFSYPDVFSFISDFVAKCSGRTWIEVAQKISALGKWEFDGYRP